MRIFKFKQNNCVPCTKLENFLKLALDVEPNESFNVSNEDEDTIEMREKFGIMGAPTLILVNDEGTEVERIVGFDGKQDEIREMFIKRG